MSPSLCGAHPSTALRCELKLNGTDAKWHILEPYSQDGLKARMVLACFSARTSWGKVWEDLRLYRVADNHRALCHRVGPHFSSTMSPKNG